MSRIGKAPVAVPANVTVTIDGQTVEVKGPKGTLSQELPAPITAVPVLSCRPCCRILRQRSPAACVTGVMSR